MKKASGDWRMCIDFTDLDKGFPTDNHALPKIDRLVDSTAENELLSFMDANAGYHQISVGERIEYIRCSSQPKAYTAIR